MIVTVGDDRDAYADGDKKNTLIGQGHLISQIFSGGVNYKNVKLDMCVF